jgi:CHAT domain-containing protein/tetratricopeptide (TPR) repeat protein
MSLDEVKSTMSVDEAMRVTATFVGGSFVPPPRTIEDITAILDQQKQDIGIAETARAKADQEAPPIQDAAVLARFYFDRAAAAAEIGRVRQEIADLTTALRHAPRGEILWPVDPNRARDGVAFIDPYAPILSKLSDAELGGGNFSRALDALRTAIASVDPKNRRGDLLYYTSRLAMLAASSGDLRTAEAALAETESLYAETPRWRNYPFPKWLDVYHKASVAQAQAAVLVAKGRQGPAEALYRRMIAVLTAEPAYSRGLWPNALQVAMASTLIAQGRLLEAESAARKAVLIALAQRGRYARYTAWVLQTLVRVILEQGRYAEAETLARAVVDIYEKNGSAPESLQFAEARAQLADALALQGRFTEALSEYERIRAALVGDPEQGRRFLEGRLSYGTVLLRNGRPEEALRVFGIALERNRRLLGDRDRHIAGVRAYMAQAYAAKGDRARALAEFRAAVPTWLSRATDGDDENATRRAEDERVVLVLADYLGLLADIHGSSLEHEAGIDAAAEAFRFAEVVRGRSVERALGASAARAAAHTPALADLIRREQDVTKQLAAIQGLLRNMLSAPSDQQDPTVVEHLRTRFETLRSARQTLAQQIAREFPTHAQLVNPPPATIDQVRASLRPGEALIATAVLRDRTLVWAIPAGGSVAFAVVPLDPKAVEVAVAKLRAALDPGATTLGEIPAFDVATAHELYEALLVPVAAGWRQAASLLIVPHGSLAQIPFTLLVTKPMVLGPERGALFARYREIAWLVRTHAVTVLPSVGALGTLRRLPPLDPSRRPFVGFGDAYFSEEQALGARDRPAATADGAVTMSARGGPLALRNLKVEGRNSMRLAMLPRLPDTRDEILSIAQAMNADIGRDVFLGAAANETSVKETNLAAYRVIAFATHGLTPGDLDGLTQPALALSAPEVAKIEGDGLLTMEEILALRLNADWVVLSACNTASGRGAGSEAISGLGRAFFYAGARALLVSNWPVETTSARALTTDLFRRQAADPRLTRAKTLQQTMNAMIDDGVMKDPATERVVVSYAHPIFWAPFTLVGDGG